MQHLRLNERALAIADALENDAAALGCAGHRVAGARIIDAGVKQRGSLGAGLRLARACIADLGQVELAPAQLDDHPLPDVVVYVDQPVAACMASQYAGWQIGVGDFFAMGSGPMRAAYGKEPLFDAIGHREQDAGAAVGILETSTLPTEEVVTYLSKKIGLAPEQITLLCARTASMAGNLQVVARSVETCLHKLHELGFDLTRTVAGFGSAPLPPVAKNDMAAIGRTNDAVLYGGRVTLTVTGDDETIRALGPKVPAGASRDHGRPFAQIFKDYHHDFYKIDPMLFSPAQVSFQNIDTGHTHTFGQCDERVLIESFFG